MQGTAKTGERRLLDLLFYVGVSLFIGHELDAVAQMEWRLLPGLGGLNDETAYTLFVALHLPLLAVLLWAAASLSLRTRTLVQQAVDVFFVLHAGLHLHFSGHEQYTFHSRLSETCIFGAFIIGLVHLLLLRRAVRSAR